MYVDCVEYMNVRFGSVFFLNLFYSVPKGRHAENTHGPRRLSRSFHSRFSLSFAVPFCFVFDLFYSTKPLRFGVLYTARMPLSQTSMFTFATATAAPAFVSIDEHIEHFEFCFSCN